MIPRYHRSAHGHLINGIAKILYENNLIPTGAFKLIDLPIKPINAGRKIRIITEYTLQEMIDELMTGRVSVSTILTIREGEDIRKIVSRLVNEYKMNFTVEQFIAEAKNDKYAEDYPFLNNIPEERKALKFQ